MTQAVINNPIIQIKNPKNKIAQQQINKSDKVMLTVLCVVFFDNMRHKRPVAPFNVNFFKSTTFRGNILGLPRVFFFFFLANMLLWTLGVLLWCSLNIYSLRSEMDGYKSEPSCGYGFGEECG